MPADPSSAQSDAEIRVVQNPTRTRARGYTDALEKYLIMSERPPRDSRHGRLYTEKAVHEMTVINYAKHNIKLQNVALIKIVHTVEIKRVSVVIVPLPPSNMG